MGSFAEDLLRLVDVVSRELLYFSLFWFIIGAVDELAIDLLWLWMRWRGRIATPRRLGAPPPSPLPREPLAILIPAWSEADVIDATVAHMLGVWRDDDWRLYVGCYCNDLATIAGAMRGAGGDPRVRIVIHDRPGPTTKADCLNRLHAAMGDDEARMGMAYRAIVLHDAEDMVHPDALDVLREGLGAADFVQLPVRPEPLPSSRWVSGHYCDEFTESHAKGLVVRHALGAALPAAGVGCAIARPMLHRIAAIRRAEGEAGPFAAECLTEDYELGVLIARLGGRSCFLRLRDGAGNLIATRSLFPGTLTEAVRQKTRWIHGIALQSWDRLGWALLPLEIWMALRDRRGPLNALVLAAAYLLLLIDLVQLGVHAALGRPMPPGPSGCWPTCPRGCRSMPGCWRGRAAASSRAGPPCRRMARARSARCCATGWPTARCARRSTPALPPRTTARASAGWRRACRRGSPTCRCASRPRAATTGWGARAAMRAARSSR